MFPAVMGLLFGAGALMFAAFIAAGFASVANATEEARSELWGAWSELGKQEATQGHQNHCPKSGRAKKAYISGWEATIRENALKAAQKAAGVTETTQ